MAKQDISAVLSKLQPLINQRLADIYAGKAIPSGGSAGGYFDYLKTPGYGASPIKDPGIMNITAPGGLKLKVHTQNLSADDKALLSSVQQIGHQQHHHSLLGGIFHNIERPFHAVTGAIAEQGDWANKSHKGESVWDRIKHSAEAIGSGAEHGWTGKSNLSVGDLHTKLGDPKSPLPTWLDPNKQDAMPQFIKNFAGDVALDPLTYTGAGGLTKVKTLAHTIEDAQKAEKIAKTLEAGGDMGHATAIKQILEGPFKEGKYYTKKQLRDSYQRTNVMRSANEAARSYADISYVRLVKSLQPAAAKVVEKQGYRQFGDLEKFRRTIKGDANHADMEQYNHIVRSYQKKELQKLLPSPEKFKDAKRAELLELATKNNLAGSSKEVADQVQKAVALRVAGKPLAKITLPKALVDGTKSIYHSDKLSKVADYESRIHNLFAESFGTKSHIDPLVNSMRMAHHSSVISKLSAHVKEINGVWAGVGKEERKRVALNAVDDSTGGVNHVIIPGGRSAMYGLPVNDLVKYSRVEVARLENLINDGKITLKQFNDALPTPYRLSKDALKAQHPLAEGWKQYLGSDIEGVKRVGQDPAVFLHVMQRAMFSAMHDREYVNQINRNFGFATHTGEGSKKVKDYVVTNLQKNHGYRKVKWQRYPGGEKKLIPGHENHVFQEDVAQAIEAAHSIIRSDKSMAHFDQHKFTQLAKEGTSIFKTVITKFNPGFHERNLLGEMLSGWADGVQSVRYYKQAARVLRHHGETELGPGIRAGRENIERTRIRNALNPDSFKHAMSIDVNPSSAAIKHSFNELPKGVSYDQVWEAYNKMGLKTGQIGVESGKYIGSAVSKASRAVDTKVQKFAENVEDYARVAHFIAWIEKSANAGEKSFERAIEEAAQHVRKFHFDYNDFTKFEKQVMGRAFPFYKWTRKNIPLQMALLFQKPGYFLSQMKALNALSGAAGYNTNGMDIPTPDAVMPQWLKDHLAVPIGQGMSGTRYLDAPLPTTDAFKFFGTGPSDTANSALFMLNPMLKMPIEHQTGHQIGGAPIQNSKYFAGITPYTNLINNLRNPSNTGKHTNLLQFLLGAGFVENTPARVHSELKRRQSAGATARKKYRKAHHQIPLG